MKFLFLRGFLYRLLQMYDFIGLFIDFFQADIFVRILRQLSLPQTVIHGLINNIIDDCEGRNTKNHSADSKESAAYHDGKYHPEGIQSGGIS